MSNSKTIAVVAVVIIIIIAAIGAVLIMQDGGGDEKTTISQKGSDTLLELMQNCAERFNENETSINVEVTGGGSGTGITALIAGEVSIAQASRQMKASEISEAESVGLNPVEWKVAIDGIAVILHADNPVDDLTMDQLHGIYNGTITNWAEVGGNDQTIVAYGRQSTSGTYAFFQEEVLDDEDYRADMQQMAGNAAIVDGVKLDEGGIGYVGIGYASASGIKITELGEEQGGDFFSPLDATAVYSGDYPLARYLYLYTDGTPTSGAINTWLKFVIDQSKGQEIVDEVGFYKISVELSTQQLAALAGTQATIDQKGSDTLLELMQNCAEQFHNDNPGINVQVTGGGSGTGIAALISGEVNIAQASRQMKSSEYDQAVAAGLNPIEWKVAIDGIAVIVHEDNPVTELTVDQLRGIYNGTITNWNQVGGDDLSVVAYGRQSTSGTYAFFQETILDDEDYRADMQQMAGNAAIVDGVSLDENGIGYVGIGYALSATGIEIVDLAEEAGGTYYSPTDATAVYGGDYVLARYLYLYTDGIPTGAEATWIEWILTMHQGQAVVEQVGFYKLSEQKADLEKAKLGTPSGTLDQKGSDTLLELMQNCAEDFHATYAAMNIQVTGGGSGTGIAALISGEVNIAQASRQMKSSEYDQAVAAGLDPVEWRVAIDGIAVIVHEDNPVTELTVDQLRGIYNGTITNWNQVGGDDLAITAYGRQSTSGTYAFFQETILDDEDYRADMQQMAGNAAIVDGVKLDDSGIGYVGIGYAVSATGIEIVELAEEAGGTYYSPLDSDAVYGGDYVLARFLYLYTDGTPEDVGFYWISWILSADGQSIVEEVGFYPLGGAVIAEELAQLGY